MRCRLLSCTIGTHLEVQHHDGAAVHSALRLHDQREGLESRLGTDLSTRGREGA